MSFYLKSNNMLWPTEEGTYDLRNKLPVGTYTVGMDPEKGWFLKPINDFQVTGKIYGNVEERADRILNTFNDRPNSTGVLLTGEKGSGKTMLAKMMSQKAAEQGISTLVINTAFCGDTFNTFIQSIDEPCVIIFDEFEKVFDDDDQEATLTLLDGVYPSKKLFLLTVNDRNHVSTHMCNRPGRIFYSIDYKGLDTSFIEEYCNDRLDAKEHIPQIIRVTSFFDSFNFDMLKALVEEMNRYKETPAQAIELLNTKPFDDSSIMHKVTVLIDNKEIDQDNFWPNKFIGNPLAKNEISYSITIRDMPPLDGHLTQDDLCDINSKTGTFTYVIKDAPLDKIVMVFTRVTMSRSRFNWVDAI